MKRQSKVKPCFFSIFCLIGFLSCQKKERPSESHATQVYETITGEKAEDQTFPDLGSGLYPLPILRQYLDLIPVGQAIDLGMGIGENSIYLAKKGFIVDGVESREGLIVKARHYAKEMGISIRIHQTRPDTFILPAEKYELVLSTTAPVSPDLMQTVEALKRAVRPGGAVFLDWNFKTKACDSIRQKITARPIKRLFAPFRVIEEKMEFDKKEGCAVRAVAIKP